MLRSIEGIYRDGKVELTESPPPDAAERVIVTFVSSPVRIIDLAERGVSPEQAADLRHRLTTFAEDWQRPEMDAYDAL
jgi:hypothetical protein